MVTNYDAFETRVLSGNKKSAFDGKRDAEGRKREAKEDFNLAVKRGRSRRDESGQCREKVVRRTPLATCGRRCQPLEPLGVFAS